MSIRKIIDWAIEDAQSTQQGTIVSDFYEYQDAAGSWVWACDVDLGGGEENVLRSVPVAANNRDIIYSEQGKGVTLSRMGNGLWAITGLSKTLNSTLHMLYVSFTDDIFQIQSSVMIGYTYRPLTYGELGTLIPPYGYGVLPYGIQGKFDYYGTFTGTVRY
jgi:hypothetical protein